MNEAGATGRQRGAGSGERGAGFSASWLPSLQEPHRIPTGVPSPGPRPGPGRLPGGRHIFLGRRNSKLLSGEWRRSPNLRQKCRHHVGARGRGEEGRPAAPRRALRGGVRDRAQHMALTRGTGAGEHWALGFPQPLRSAGTPFPCPDTEGDPSHQGLREDMHSTRPARARRPSHTAHPDPRGPGSAAAGAPSTVPAAGIRVRGSRPSRPQALRAACRRRPAGSCPPLQAREAPCQRELDSLESPAGRVRAVRPAPHSPARAAPGGARAAGAGGRAPGPTPAPGLPAGGHRRPRRGCEAGNKGSGALTRRPRRAALRLPARAPPTGSHGPEPSRGSKGLCGLEQAASRAGGQRQEGAFEGALRGAGPGRGGAAGRGGSAATDGGGSPAQGQGSGRRGRCVAAGAPGRRRVLTWSPAGRAALPGAGACSPGPAPARPCWVLPRV